MSNHNTWAQGHYTNENQRFKETPFLEQANEFALFFQDTDTTALTLEWAEWRRYHATS